MKTNTSRKVALLTISVLFFYACTNQSNVAEVSGTIQNMNDGEIYFIPSSDSGRVDTVQVKEGKFNYTLKLMEPTVCMINFGADKQPGIAILEKGKTSISYDANAINSLVVKSGKEQEVYNQFLIMCRPTFKKMDSIGKLAQLNEDNQAMLASLQETYFELDATLKSKQQQFIKEHPSNIATAFIAKNYFEEKQDKELVEIEPVFNGLDKQTQATYYGRKLAEMIALIKNTSIGALAPDFTLNNLEGKPISLSSFKGKFTLIDFWASWCGPCRADNPNVVLAYEHFHSKGFEIVGVSLDKQKPQWESAIRKDGLLWQQVSDLAGWESKVAIQYGVQSIPTNFLLDHEGRIIAKNLHGDALENKLHEVIK